MTTNVNLLLKSAIPYTRNIVACCLAVRLANQAIDHYLKDAYPLQLKVLKGVVALYALTTMPSTDTVIALLILANCIQIVYQNRHASSTAPQANRADTKTDRINPLEEALAISNKHILCTREECIAAVKELYKLPADGTQYEPWPDSIELAADIVCVENHNHYDIELTRNFLVLAAAQSERISTTTVEEAYFSKVSDNEVYNCTAKRVNRIKPNSMKLRSNIRTL